MTDVTVQSGQIWADTARGQAGRTVRVDRIGELRVHCTVMTPRTRSPHVRTGCTFSVPIEAMVRLYRLVSDVEVSA